MDPTLNQIKNVIVPTLYLFFSLAMSGCNSSDPQAYISCKNRLSPVWADPKQLHSDITTLTADEFAGRKTGTQGAELSRQFIASRFEEIGLAPWESSYSVPFTYQQGFSERQGVNMVAVSYAKKPTSKWRIVLAHYDHLGKKGRKVYSGADDNASGVAALLHIAAQIKRSESAISSTQRNSIKQQANYLFIATDAEEPGLFGSYALVEKLKSTGVIPQVSQIELAVNLDMVGRPGRPYAIYLEGRAGFDNFNVIQQKIAAQNNLCIKATHPRSRNKSVRRVDWLRASDHYPFHKAGVPWLYFGVPPHRDYHSPSDTVEKIDLKFLAAVTESAYQLLVIDSLLLK